MHESERVSLVLSVLGEFLLICWVHARSWSCALLSPEWSLDLHGAHVDMLGQATQENRHADSRENPWQNGCGCKYWRPFQSVCRYDSQVSVGVYLMLPVLCVSERIWWISNSPISCLFADQYHRAYELDEERLYCFENWFLLLWNLKETVYHSCLLIRHHSCTVMLCILVWVHAAFWPRCFDADYFTISFYCLCLDRQGVTLPQRTAWSYPQR